MSQYNETVAKEIYENALKYAGKQEEWDWKEHHIIDARRMACHLLVEKIERFLDNLGIKDHKVILKEYSNIRPELRVELPYKSINGDIYYDKYGLYFDRDQYLYEDNTRLNTPNATMWLPGDWWNYLCFCHKKNKLIFDKLMEEFPILRIGMLVNYPFIVSWKDEHWPFKDCLNLT